MVYFPKSKGKSKRPYRKRFPKAKAKSKLYQAVKRVVSRQIETKTNDVEVQQKVIYGYIDGTTFSNLLPTLTHGTGQGSRIGNRINCVNLTLRMSMFCLPYSNAVGPYYFDVYIYKMKQKANDPPTNTEFQLFLQDGNTATQYVGGVLDGLRIVNTDLFTPICHKRYLMSNYTNNTSFVGATASINPCRNIIMNLTKHVKKTWIYNDNFSSVQNDSLYMSVGCSTTDGTLLPLSAQLGTYSFLVESNYKDA